MAYYTMRLNDLFQYYTREEVENWFKAYNINDYLLPEQAEIVSKSNIFNKDKLAKKIVDNYYMSEIGLETPALFRHYAKIHMEEIMESKLPLIYTMCLEYDPLVNVDFTETFNRSVEGSANSQGSTNGTSNSSSNSNGSGLTINSDTPQGKINKSDILAGNYATNTSANETNSNITDETKNNSSSTSSGKSSNTEE